MVIWRQELHGCEVREPRGGALMPAIEPRFALNHIIAPRLGIRRPSSRSRASSAIDAVEIRNDIAGNAILDGTPAGADPGAGRGMRACGSCRSTRCSGSTTGGPSGANEALALADYAAACGAEALVLVPSNDGTPPDRLPRGARGAAADPGVAAAGRAGRAAGLCDQRAAPQVGGRAGDRRGRTASADFRLVHDTFHHHLAGEDGAVSGADRARAYLRGRRPGR